MPGAAFHDHKPRGASIAERTNGFSWRSDKQTCETESVRGLISFCAKAYQFRQIAAQLAPAVLDFERKQPGKDVRGGG